MLPDYTFSQTRLNYLLKTINALGNHGSVYLVRLPVHKDILKIENELMPDFDPKINDIVKSLEVPYFDMTLLGQNFKYTDGNHLEKGSGKLASELVANWILSNEKMN